MKGQRGFTLIEALISGTIALGLPAVVIVVLKVSSSRLASTSNVLKLTQIANGISEDIHRTALLSTYVYNWEEVLVGCPPATAPIATHHLTGVVFYDQACAAIKGYRVVRMSSPNTDRGEMLELIAGAWTPINYAGDFVRVTYNPDAYSVKATGLFGIFPKGDFTWHNLRYDMEITGTRTLLPMQTQSVVCRNAPSRLMSW